MKTYDVIIIGAGAAGLMAARELKLRQKRALVIDFGDTPARKVAVSGGGNCNFTNTNADFLHYFGKNPRFVVSALSQWGPDDTLNWVKSHKIEFVEKEPGRYFCKNGAKGIIDALMRDIGDTEIKYNTNVLGVEKSNDLFVVHTSNGDEIARSVIVASGGVSYPHLGVSNIGHIIAKKFGHKIEPVRPGLCAIKTKVFSPDLAGVAKDVKIRVEKHTITGDLLFTHSGLGGPVIYRATLLNPKQMVIDFAPDVDVFNLLKKKKQTAGKKIPGNILSEILPNKLAHFLCGDTRHIADLRDAEIKQIADTIKQFEINDGEVVGFQSAEITLGGVNVDKISSKTMESKLCPGLYFVGEVMDITGDLGGYNLQWAFTSGTIAGRNA